MLSSSERKFMEYIHGQSGSFFTHLFDAIKVADSENMERLRQGFPEEVVIVEKWRIVPGYSNALEAEYHAP